MTRATVIRLAVALGPAALAAGLAGIGIRIATGHELAAYGSYIPWGLWVALYAYFMGLSAGAFLFFATGELFRIERLRRVGRPALLTPLPPPPPPRAVPSPAPPRPARRAARAGGGGGGGLGGLAARLVLARRRAADPARD